MFWIYIVNVFGLVSVTLYLYLLCIKKSQKVSSPSRITIILIAFIFIIGGLIKYSQIYMHPLGPKEYFDILLVAFMLPSCAVGMAVINYLGNLAIDLTLMLIKGEK